MASLANLEVPEGYTLWAVIILLLQLVLLAYGIVTLAYGLYLVRWGKVPVRRLWAGSRSYKVLFLEDDLADEYLKLLEETEANSWSDEDAEFEDPPEESRSGRIENLIRNHNIEEYLDQEAEELQSPAPVKPNHSANTSHSAWVSIFPTTLLRVLGSSHR